MVLMFVHSQRSAILSRTETFAALIIRDGRLSGSGIRIRPVFH